MRRPLLYFAVLLASGILASEHAPGGRFVLGAGLTAAAAALIFGRIRAVGAGLAATAALALGWARGDDARRVPSNHLSDVPVGYAGFQGRIVRPFKKYKFFSSAWVETDSAFTDGQAFSVSGRILLKITSSTDFDYIPDGATVRFFGRFKSVDLAVEHAGFLGYLKLQRITHEATAKGVVVVSHSGLRADLWRIRRFFAAPFEQKLTDARIRGVALALILGERAELDPELRAAYAAGGAAHILALSGAHLMMLSLLIQRLTALMKLLPGGRTAATFLLVALLMGYALMTGAAPSVVRAAWTASLLALAPLVYRRADPLNVLGAAFSLQILYDPFVLYDWGFQLSYAAVAGILLLVPALEGKKFKHKIAKAAWDLAAVSLAAQLFTLPFVLYYFGQFPVHFLWVNLALFPLVGLAMPVGFALAALGRMPFASDALAVALAAAISVMNALTTTVAGWEHSIWHAKLDRPWQAWALAATLLAATLLFRRLRFGKSDDARPPS